MGGNAKGSGFERSVCKQLSNWWSSGLEGKARDDIFWRSSQSGGRATQRAKQGKATFGAYGDIAAVDPVGQPLLRLVTIELKRGRSHGHPIDSIESKVTSKPKPFELAVAQASRSAELAKSVSWWLLCRPDRREAMLYMPFELARRFPRFPATRIRYRFAPAGKSPTAKLDIVGVRWEEFLSTVPPKALLAMALP